MASKEEIDRLVGKFLIDAEFRQAFLDDPKTTAASLGIELNDMQLEKAGKLKKDKIKLDKLAKDAVDVAVTGPYAWG